MRSPLALLGTQDPALIVDQSLLHIICFLISPDRFYATRLSDSVGQLFYCSRQRFVALCKDLGRAFYLCRIRAYKNAGEYASDTIEKGFEHSRHKLAGKHLFQKSGYRSEHTVKQSCYELRGIISKRIEYLQDRPDKSAYLASKLSKSLADTITAFIREVISLDMPFANPYRLPLLISDR